MLYNNKNQNQRKFILLCEKAEVNIIEYDLKNTRYKKTLNKIEGKKGEKREKKQYGQ